MSEGRCPSCGASVRAGVDWCSLCYADLRPAPPPPPPPPPPPAPEPVAVPVAAATAPAATVPAAAAPGGPDPLSAPYDAILGATLAGTPLAGEPEKAPTWPCFECGGANPFDVMGCETCGAGFGARLATRRDETSRRDRMIRVLIGLGVFLAVLAIVSYALTPAPAPPSATEQPVPGAVGVESGG